MPGAGGRLEAQRSLGWTDRQPAEDGRAWSRDEGGRAQRKGWGEGGREGRGRIDSLSSTGTTVLSCHGEGGAAGTASGGRRSHMPGGRRQKSRSPPSVQLPPDQASGPRGQAGRGAGLTRGAKSSSLPPEGSGQEPQGWALGWDALSIASQRRPETRAPPGGRQAAGAPCHLGPPPAPTLTISEARP